MKHKLDEELEDILTHFGVKGMKWGVRRDPIELEGGEGGGGGGGDAEEEEEDEGLLDELSDDFKDLMKDASKTADEVMKLAKTKMKDIRVSFSLNGKALIKKLAKRSRDKAYNKAERQNEILREYLRTNGKPDPKDLRRIEVRDFAAERDLRGYIKTQKNKRATTAAKQYNDGVSGNGPKYMTGKDGKRKQVRNN